MHLWRKFLRDEGGYLLSSELVLVGTVGVVGATVGLQSLRNSLTEEFSETARAIRSLDQSYCFSGTSGCGAWTAGSSYVQPPVEADLNGPTDSQGLPVEPVGRPPRETPQRAPQTEEDEIDRALRQELQQLEREIDRLDQDVEPVGREGATPSDPR